MVSEIAQTKDGYLWLGTQHGVVRFDGRRFTIFSPENLPGLKSSYVETLLADRAGALWVGTLDGGVSKIQDGRVETYTTKEGLTSNQVQSLYEDHAGRIWIGTLDGSLSKIWQGNITSTLGPHLNGFGGIVRTILEGDQGRFWLTAPAGNTEGHGESGPARSDAAGILCLEHDKLTRYSIYDGKQSIAANTVLANGDGTLWVGSKMGAGLFRPQKNTYTRVWPKILSRNVTVRSIVRDRDGSIWLGTGAGLKRLHNGIVDSYAARDGLSSDSIYSVLADRDGNIWVGTSGGLDRLADRSISSYSQKQGLSANQVWSVVEDRRGAIWIGSNAGLDRIGVGKIRHYTTKDGLPSNVVYSVQEAPEGPIWFTTEGGLCRLRDGKVRVFGAEDGLPSPVVALAWRRDGTMLVSPTRSGLYSFKNSRFAPVLSLPDYVVSVSEAHDGSLWLSTFGQLVNWKDQRLTEYGSRSDMYSYSYEDGSGTVWAGSIFGGLVCVKRGKLIRFAPLGAPFNDRIYRIFEDTLENLWITTPHGLFRIKKTDLTDYVEGRLNQVFAAEFGMADGLPSTGCNGGEQNAGWTDRRGRFWIPTGRGLAMLDPRRIKVNRIPPHTIIEEVSLDNRTIDLRTYPKFSPDHKRLQIRYTGIDLHAPYGVRFRYQLEGFDKDWVNAGTSGEVSYTGLRPGEYRFRVTSRNRDGFWDVHPPSFSFRVAPHFYNTLWFYSFCGALSILVVGAGHHWHVRSIRERAEIAMVERARMAREIHDTLLQGVSGASLVLEAIAPAITSKEIRQRFDSALNEMQRCMTETRQALWDMRSRLVEGVDFAQRLERYGHALTAGTEIQFLLQVNSSMVEFPTAVQYNLLRIGQEAIFNAVKHSRGSKITVIASLTDGVKGGVKVSHRGGGKGDHFFPSEAVSPLTLGAAGA